MAASRHVWTSTFRAQDHSGVGGTARPPDMVPQPTNACFVAALAQQVDGGEQGTGSTVREPDLLSLLQIQWNTDPHHASLFCKISRGVVRCDPGHRQSETS